MEHVALYRQFRPKNFDEIVEQKAAVATLRQTVKTGKIGHAYLFCGQRGTGKTSIARVFSRAINCENPQNGNPCNSCPTCKGILDGSLMDVIEIDAASNRSIDNVRKICEEVTYTPSRAPHKVYIIDEVHMITSEAFNALLKTLEEPPAHAVFLFATTEPHSIPATILSRCQRFDFRRIPQESIIGRLKYISEQEKINISDDALTLIASLSDGAMRDAISMLDQAGSSANGAHITAETIEDMTGSVNKAFLADMAEILIDGRFDALLIACGKLAESGRDTIQFTLDLAQYFRDLLVVRMMPDPTSLITASATTIKRMYEIASKTNSQTLVAFISSLSKTVAELKWSPSVRTSFEITLLRLCGRKVKADEVPLVIPDFAKKQAEAVPSIEAKFAGVSTPVAAPETEIAPVETKVEPIKEEPAPAEPVKTESEPVKAETPVPAKEEPAKEEVKPIETKPAEPVVEKPKEEIVTIAPSFPVSDEAEASEDTPDESPMENQMDLFSFASVDDGPAPSGEPVDDIFSVKAEEKKEEKAEEKKEEPVAVPKWTKPVIPVFPKAEEPSPKKEEKKPETPAPKSGKGIFADISKSFLDDIKIEEEPAQEEAVNFPSANDSFEGVYEPTGRIGETKKTRLSAVLDTTPIVQSKEVPVKTPDDVWAELLKRVEQEDFTLSHILNQANFKYEDNSAFIIFANEDRGLINSLTADARYKQISPDIKREIENCEKVYLCTETQYQNMQLVIKKGANVRDALTGKSKAEEFLNGVSKEGIDTKIHFGDD